jgi:hypothetical protein
MIFITDDTLIPINRVIGKTRINNNIFVNFKSNNIIIEKENGLVLNQVNLSKFKDILKIYYLSESMVLLITTPEYIYYNRLRLKFNDMEFNGIIERKNNILFTKFIFNDLSYTFDEPKAVVPEKIIRYKDLTIANSGLSSKLIILGIDDKYYISYEITYLNTQSIILLNNKDSDKKIKEFYEKYYDTIEEVIEKYYKNLNQYII